MYEVADHELDLLEKGSPSSIYLNFAIFCLSTGLSFTINILSLDIQSIKIFTVFLVFSTIGILVGLILIFLWYRSRSTISEIVKKIRGRVNLNS